MEYIFLFSFIFLNIITFFKLNLLTDIIDLYDNPDNKRKIHSQKVSKIAGLILFLNYCLYFIYSLINNYNLSEIKLFLILTISFLISLYNDKKDIKPAYRLIIFYFIFLIWTFIDNELLIKQLNFEINNLSFDLGILGYFLTPLFILIFFNALNLYDGVNLQSIFFLIIFFIFFLIKNIEIFSYSYFIIFILVFVYFNFKNKVFLGDSGVSIIAIVLSYLVITNYNRQNNLFCDEIFLIMFLPGIDMLRVYFLRIYYKKNPFKPDRNHLHHYLINKFPHQVIFLFQVIFYLPILYLVYSVKIDLIYAIILMSLAYIFVIVLINDKKGLS